MNITAAHSAFLLSPRVFRNQGFLSALALRAGDHFLFWTPFGNAHFIFSWRNRGESGRSSLCLFLPTHRLMNLCDRDICVFCARCDADGYLLHHPEKAQSHLLPVNPHGDRGQAPSRGGRGRTPARSSRAGLASFVFQANGVRSVDTDTEASGIESYAGYHVPAPEGSKPGPQGMLA